MQKKISLICPITGDKKSKKVFIYNSPPISEIPFKRQDNEAYHRTVWQFYPSKHFISVHDMNVLTTYEGEYVAATYGDSKLMKSTFDKIISLPNNKSDNVGRFEKIKEFTDNWFPSNYIPNLLDIGSGLGVFPYILKLNGWQCTALDPDKKAVEHIEKFVGVNTIYGDFMKISPSSKYDIISLNKVLEHVNDPVQMLSKVNAFLKPEGFVYVEVPDGEVAYKDGPEREEFFIEHLHVFSLASTVIMANKAGFQVEAIQRLKEPSTKYTIRAFLSYCSNQ